MYWFALWGIDLDILAFIFICRDDILLSENLCCPSLDTAAYHHFSYYIIPIRLWSTRSIRRWFSVSLYLSKVFFVYLSVNFCFRFLKYFSKSNVVTNSPDWFAPTLNTWLLDSPHLQNHLTSSDRRYLNKKMWCPQSLTSALCLLCLYREEEGRELLKEDLDFCIC